MKWLHWGYKHAAVAGAKKSWEKGFKANIMPVRTKV